MTNPPTHTNRLSKETSPYLLQHQHNPVDWYPWGPEAFDRARAENKPIFLSVGYSTCYWCHVMERQCFENPAIAKLMNDLFINIKVDREQRPDVDQLYMTSVQILTRHGGWPMSVFLTPDLRPFFAGTYFPPADSHGRPGFPTILRSISDAFHTRPQDVDSAAKEILQILRQLAEPPQPKHPITLDARFIESLLARSISDYDPANGGFGSAPKFPRETLLELLLHCTESPLISPERQQRIRTILHHTLTSLAAGGIRDQLGGGFHRYSTDAHWLVPHFEIMLYDNAMLGWCYVEFYRQTQDAHFADIARGIFDFVLRDMTSPNGAFYTAFDAEVDSQEGLNYLWTKDEIEDLLGPTDAPLVTRVYGLDEGPNFADPHHGTGQSDKNILFLPEPLSTVAARLKLTESELQSRLEPLRAKLLAARKQRKQPLLDTKILPSWNALMIRALAHGSHVLNEPRYLTAATQAATYLLSSFQNSEFKIQNSLPSFLDDHAFLLQALLTLHHVTSDPTWLTHAHRIRTQMLQQFRDSAHGGFYFTSATATDILVRQKIAADSPLPGGNAAAALSLLSLNQPDAVAEILRPFAAQLQQQGESMSSLLQAVLLYIQQHGPLHIQPRNTAPSPTLVEQAQDLLTLTPQHISPTQLHLHLTLATGYHLSNLDLRLDGATLASFHLHETHIDVQLASPPPGPFKIFLRYQPCTDQACLAPVIKEIALP